MSKTRRSVDLPVLRLSRHWLPGNADAACLARIEQAMATRAVVLAWR